MNRDLKRIFDVEERGFGAFFQTDEVLGDGDIRFFGIGGGFRDAVALDEFGDFLPRAAEFFGDG